MGPEAYFCANVSILNMKHRAILELIGDADGDGSEGADEVVAVDA